MKVFKHWLFMTYLVISFSLTMPGMVIFPAAIAEALASTEESAPAPAYSKEDLRAALLSIRDNIISPDQEDLDFLGEVKDELAVHVASMQSAADEIKSAIPDFNTQDFESEDQDADQPTEIPLPLSEEQNTPQIDQCAKNWSNINFNNVTSCTMRKSALLRSLLFLSQL